MITLSEALAAVCWKVVDAEVNPLVDGWLMKVELEEGQFHQTSVSVSDNSDRAILSSARQQRSSSPILKHVCLEKHYINVMNNYYYYSFLQSFLH